MVFEVIRPGFLALLQDYGRYGMQHLGMATGGPLDEHAFVWANRLLGNHYNSATLEITLGQVRLRALQGTRIAITGADLGACINDQPIVPWCSYRVEAGDSLSFAGARTGVRAYLAVSGGFEAPLRYGSCATVVREGCGGLHGDGQRLQAGDRLGMRLKNAGQGALQQVPPRFVPDYGAPLCLRLLPGYQYDQFDAEQLERLFGSDYRVSPDSDRMGYRLAGPAIQSGLDGIISEGIAFGAVQIPGDGQPIVLLRDRQTIGGYPKVGCVAALDAAQLAQRAPGALVRFRRGDLREVETQRQAFNRFFGIGG
ncbi:biotin-dependent carboxyltransferase family protein [Marinobacterium rhizophilum]|uniref:Biotin-dependent carboxyltransferase n=1 Tax=Marinobacterium rhizophilum TaxID=420402 RepID=A0ABY5HMT8_9GAMM|nr:biotin-dependent carboxyltransferase family protein [Marinobacterium rhizophilum]UTW12216.1 biotin-dependent carboxyltransferase [Marinobacterium rhizophilum]